MLDKSPCKILRGIPEIIEYLNCSQKMFQEYVKMGMPARIVCNKWHAHADNLDGWFRDLTLCQTKGEVPEDVE